MQDCCLICTFYLLLHICILVLNFCASHRNCSLLLKLSESVLLELVIFLFSCKTSIPCRIVNILLIGHVCLLQEKVEVM